MTITNLDLINKLAAFPPDTKVFVDVGMVREIIGVVTWGQDICIEIGKEI